MTPKGWADLPISEFAEIEMGETLIGKDLTGDGIPVFSAGRDPHPWGFTSHNKKSYRRGTIILVARGTIGYSIRRSPRRRTVSIAVYPGLGIVVTAPKTTPTEKLDAVVRGKGAWLVGKLRRNAEAAPLEREFVDGETFLYLGKQYRLKVLKEPENPDRVALVGGRMVVSLGQRATHASPQREQADSGPRAGGKHGPSSVGARHAPPAIRPLLVAWYRRHAEERIATRVALWAERMGLPVPRVVIREQRQCWASCGPDGSLRFNWRIVQAPARFIDYVVAHELVHLRHRDHTAEFWAALGDVMPDYEKRREGLRRVGGRLVW